MAHGFLASAQLGVTPPKDRVDIVHTEILSAHHEVDELTAQNIVTMSLFADGFIKYSVATEDHLRSRGLAGLKILAYTEHLLADSADAETLAPGPTRFRIYISIMTPVFIKAAVKDLVEDLMHRAGLDFERERHRLTNSYINKASRCGIPT
jgi:alkylresorcinol/alkylpyrone synthase